MKGYNSYLIFVVLVSFGMSTRAMDDQNDGVGAQVRFRGALPNGGSAEITINRPSVLEQADLLAQGASRAIVLAERTLDIDLKRRDADLRRLQSEVERKKIEQDIELRRVESEVSRKKMESDRESSIAEHNRLQMNSDWNNSIKKNFLAAVCGSAVGFILRHLNHSSMGPNISQPTQTLGVFGVAAAAIGLGFKVAKSNAALTEFGLYSLASWCAFEHFLKNN